MRRSETDVVGEIERITLRRLRLWVRNGWIAPEKRKGEPRFDELDLARIRLVCELKDELNLNDDAVPVVLSLLDQLYSLRREFKALGQAIDQQPDDIRDVVRSTYRELLNR